MPKGKGGVWESFKLYICNQKDSNLNCFSTFFTHNHHCDVKNARTKLCKQEVLL